MKTTKKFFALLLVVSLMASMLAMGVSAAGGAQIVSQQLSLGDDLTMRFGVEVDSQYQNDAVISVTVAGETASYNVAEMTAENGKYTVSVDLAAAQMTDAIAVKVISGETELDADEYSVRAYCQYLLEGDYTDATKQMVKEVLNYGAKAQIYFDYNTENLANAGYELESAAVPTEGYDMTIDGSVAGINLYGTSLVFSGKIAVRYYFSASDVSGYTFTANGVSYDAEKKQDGLYYVEIGDINPQEYADVINLTVSDGTDSLVVGYCPLSYIVRMSQKTSSVEMKDLLAAMYSYYLEARSFTGVQENDDRVTLPVHIIDHEVIGTWADAKEGSASLGPVNSYDGNTGNTDADGKNDYWNPAITDFMSGEGIIYTLDNTYDLTSFVMYSHRIFYFTLYGSSDGVTYTQIARVGSGNAADYYTGEVGSYVCEVNELAGKAVKYLKVEFTGCANVDATHVAVFEIELGGKKPTAVSDGRVEFDSVIIGHAIKGTWKNNREGTSATAARTYDGSATTNWNPEVTNFKSGEAIIYTLDALTELTDVTVTFGTRLHYFDLSVSADGSNFIHVARVNAQTASKYYDGLVATIENIGINAKYIRMDLLGTENGTTWYNMMEIEVDGKAPVVVDDGRIELDSIIVGHTIEGTWKNNREGTSATAARTYDGSATTNWNPEVTNFKSGEAIIYTLDGLTEVTDITLTFGSRLHYFDLSVSADGSNFIHVARVNAQTASKYYNGLVATVENIGINAKYIRMDLLGTENGTTWYNMMEIEVDGKAAIVAEDGREDVAYSIIANSVEGGWTKTQEGNASAGPEKSYDDSVDTIWNPQATNYTSGEAIVYTLDKAYDLDAVALTFKNREYYFDLSVSGDGINYTHVARVNAQTMTKYYNGLTANVNGIGATGVKYIKVSFLGANTADNTKFVALANIALSCKEYVADKTNAVAATISGGEVIGTWIEKNESSASIGPKNSYDGDKNTNWNANTTNFKGGEGIIYTLDKAYDLTEINLTFGTRVHYFDLYVSADGVNYLPVAFVNADNAAAYYGDDLVATIDNLTNTGVVYIKVLFTGNAASGNTYINLFESEASGK